MKGVGHRKYSQPMQWWSKRDVRSKKGVKKSYRNKLTKTSHMSTTLNINHSMYGDHPHRASWECTASCEWQGFWGSQLLLQWRQQDVWRGWWPKDGPASWILGMIHCNGLPQMSKHQLPTPLCSVARESRDLASTCVPVQWRRSDASVWWWWTSWWWSQLR